MELRRPRDWHDPRLLRQHPGERELRRRDTLRRGDAAQAIDDRSGLTLADASRSRDAIASGALVAVLEQFSTPFPGFYLYYAQRRLASAALRGLVEYLRRGRGR